MRWRPAIATLLLVALFVPASVAASPPDHVRIAVMGLFHSSQFAVEVSPASPMLVDSGQRQFVAGVDARQSVAIVRSGREIIVRAGGSQIVSENFTFSGSQGGECDFVLAVPGKLHRHYRGKLIITVGNQELLTVVEIELETGGGIRGRSRVAGRCTIGSHESTGCGFTLLSGERRPSSSVRRFL